MNQVYIWNRLWYSIGALFVALVVYFSLMPSPSQLDVSAGDKIQHLAGYSLLGYWFSMLFLQYLRGQLIGMILLMLLGVCLEFVQGMTGYRSYDTADMQANGVGVLLGTVLARTRLGGMLLWIEQHGASRR